MKKLFLFTLVIVFSIQFLSSCSFDEQGEPYINWFGWLIIIGIPILFALLVKSGNEHDKKQEQALKKFLLSKNDLFYVGNYVGGHPDLNDEINSCSIFLRDKNLTIVAGNAYEENWFKAIIPSNSINEILIEDSSTFEKRLSAGRLLLVGVFAFAWKKNKKNEMAFLTIEWSYGKFNHSTIFNFTGEKAFQRANTSRNNILKLIDLN